MKKLSEIKDDEMLLVGDECMTKEDLINNYDYMENKEQLKGKIVFTTSTYKACFDASQLIDDAIERESFNMYEDWDIDMQGSVRREDVEEIQKILDRMLERNRSNNITYFENEEVEID